MAAFSIVFDAPDNHTTTAVAGPKPIDLGYLASRTDGNKDLENEILRLFSRNARAMLHELSLADDASAGSIAHRLKGSADSIGAFKLSAAAEAVENGRRDGAELAKVAAAVVETENFILKLCR